MTISIHNILKQGSVLKNALGVTGMLLLSNCGGGDGGSTTPAVQPVVYSGATTQAQITQANQSRIYILARGGLIQTQGMAASATANNANANDSNATARSVISPSWNALNQISYPTQLNSTINTGVNSAIKGSSANMASPAATSVVNGTVSGTATWSGSVDINGAGNLTAIYMNYDNGTGALTGTVHYNIRSSDIYTGQIYDMTASYQLLEFSFGSIHTKETGSFDVYYSRTTYSISFIDLTSNTQYKYENLIWDNNSPIFPVSGRIYEQNLGYFDITTNIPFAYYGTYPSSGSVTLSGSNGSTLIITAASGTRVAISLDENGDGIAESANMYLWGSEFTTPQPDSPPILNGVNLTPQDVYTDTSITAAIPNGSDPDGDTCIATFDWKVNGTSVHQTTSTYSQGCSTDSTYSSLPNGLFAKGDSITVDATLSDGLLSTQVSSASINVLNSPPTGTVTLTPVSPTATDIISSQLSAVSDPDNDTLNYSYAWYRNGAVIAGQTASTLLPANFGPGDRIGVDAVISDGTAAYTSNATVDIYARPVVIAPITPAPVNAVSGQTVNFQISATQGDALPVTYSVLYGPSNMSVDAYGNVSWTPQEPMLSSSLTVNYAIRASSNTVSSDYVASTVVTYPNFQQPLINRTIPSSSFVGGFLATTTPPNKQVIFSTVVNDMGNLVNKVIRIDPLTYNTTVDAPLSCPPLQQNEIDVFDFDGDGTDELFLWLQSWPAPEEFSAYDLQTNSVDQAIPLAHFFSPDHVDINNDGIQELVGRGANTVMVIDTYSNSVLWESAPFAGSWGYRDRNVFRDTNNDGFPELFASSISGITAFDNSAGAFVAKGSISSYTPDDFEVADIDGNGTYELVVANAGSISIYDANSLNLIHQYTLPFGVTEIAIEQPQQIGRKNLLLSAGDILSGFWLTLVDAFTGSEIWSSSSIIGAVNKNSLRYADVNNNGVNQLIIGTDQEMYITR